MDTQILEDQVNSLDYSVPTNRVYNLARKKWIYGQNARYARSVSHKLKNAIMYHLIRIKELHKTPKLKDILQGSIDKKKAAKAAARIRVEDQNIWNMMARN